MSQHKEAPTDPAAEDSAAPGPEADSSPNPEVHAPHDLEPATEIQQLQAELEKARMEAAENLDRFLRAKAEAENMRKRGEMDVAATRKYAIERFASEIILCRIVSVSIGSVGSVTGSSLWGIRQLRGAEEHEAPPNRMGSQCAHSVRR